jgi:preprotein translocase subunit SecG
MLPVLVFFHFVTCIALVGLVLLHSGRDTGMSGMGFVPASQGGTHIVEKNLTRLTIVVSTIFFVNTILLFRLLD